MGDEAMKNPKRKLTGLVACLTISLRVAWGTDYHVDSVNGRDGASGTIEDPLRHVASLAGQLKGGDVVSLASGTYDQPVRLSDRGTPDAPIVIRNAEGHEPVISGTSWKLEGASHVIIEGLTFRRCPSPALVFGEDACDSVLRRCRLIDCPPPARTNLTERTAWLRAISAPGPSAHRNRIEDCRIQRPYGGYYAVNEGLNIHEANHHWIVRGNHFSGYMYGLQLGVGAQGDPPAYILIESNKFSDCNHAVHVKTSDNIVRGNHIHDMRHGYRGYGTGVYIRGGSRTVVENNRIERAEWAGVRVNGTDHLMRNNVITHTAVGVWLSSHSYGTAGPGNWIVHNTIADSVLPICLEGGTQAHVFNNILAADKRRGPGIFVYGHGMANPVADWNAAMYKRMAGDKGQPSARLLAADYNLFFNVTQPDFQYLFEEDASWHRHYRTYGKHNLEADPHFVDRENGDLRLRLESPARSAGRTLPNCPTDLASMDRPASRPDLGAFQVTTK